MNKDYNKYVEEYLKLPFEDILIKYRRKFIVENILKQNILPKGVSILEVGCGMSPLFTSFDDNVQFTIVEPAKIFFDNACSYKNNNYKILNKQFEEITEKIGHFDYIIISCLLHEINDTELFFNKLLEIASENTQIFISVPNSNSLHRKLAFEIGLIDNIDVISDMQIKMQQAKSFYNIDKLIELCKFYNFKIVSRGGYFLKLFTHKQMSYIFQEEQILPNNVLDGLYNLGILYPEIASEIYVKIIKNENKISRLKRNK